jgi:predicted alpha/beta-fold hydrolase
MEITKAGGHVGFISGSNPFKANYWLEQRIPEYLQKQIDEYSTQ